MTKGRVVVGKIESWLAEFESWAMTSRLKVPLSPRTCCPPRGSCAY